VEVRENLFHWSLLLTDTRTSVLERYDISAALSSGCVNRSESAQGLTEPRESRDLNVNIEFKNGRWAQPLTKTFGYQNGVQKTRKDLRPVPELVVQAASSHYPLFNWYQQFKSQRHARDTDAETFVLFYIWVPRSLFKGYEQSYWFPTNPGYCKVPRSSHLAFVKKNLEVSPRNLYTWTWPQQWERFSSTGNSRPARGLGENCNWILRDVLSRRRTVSWWPGSLLFSWCDVTSM